MAFRMPGSSTSEIERSPMTGIRPGMTRTVRMRRHSSNISVISEAASVTSCEVCETPWSSLTRPAARSARKMMP